MTYRGPPRGKARFSLKLQKGDQRTNGLFLSSQLFPPRVPSHSLRLNPGLPTVTPLPLSVHGWQALATSLNVPTSAEGKEGTRGQEKKMFMGSACGPATASNCKNLHWAGSLESFSTLAYQRVRENISLYMGLSAWQYFILLCL